MNVYDTLTDDQMKHLRGVAAKVRGARWIDLQVRINGTYQYFEADWMKQILRNPEILEIAREPWIYRKLWRLRFVVFPAINRILRFFKITRRPTPLPPEKQAERLP